MKKNSLRESSTLDRYIAHHFGKYTKLLDDPVIGIEVNDLLEQLQDYIWSRFACQMELGELKKLFASFVEYRNAQAQRKAQRNAQRKAQPNLFEANA